jgi:hypothetical protein
VADIALRGAGFELRDFFADLVKDGTHGEKGGLSE